MAENTTNADRALAALMRLGANDLDRMDTDLLDAFACLAIRYGAMADALLRRRRREARQAERNRAHARDVEGAGHA